jgi:hypothetical protein
MAGPRRSVNCTTYARYSAASPTAGAGGRPMPTVSSRTA